MRTILQHVFAAMQSGDNARAKALLAQPYHHASTTLSEHERTSAERVNIQLHAMLRPEADGARAAYADKLLSLGILQHESNIERTLEAISNFTHSTMHEIDERNMRKSQAFDSHEQNLLKTRGRIGYAASLMTRRFSNEHHFQHVHVSAPTPESSSSQRPMLRNIRKGGLNMARLVDDAPPPPPAMETLEADALLRYGGIAPVHTPMQKLRFAGAMTASIGLIAHGGKNILAGFISPETTATPPQDNSPSQMIAGALESSLGIAIGIRSLTGRWGVTKPVQSSLQKLLDCTHDIHR